MTYTKVFSEFEVTQIGFKFNEESAYESCECVGSAEDAAEAKTVVKKCRGVEVKTRTRGTGKGEIKLSLHIPYNIYVKMLGMEDENLKDGVVAYGDDSRHAVFSMVAKVEDEDGNVKYKAYPNCIIKEAPSNSTENGAEEIAELEVTISYMPDEHGKGRYEAIESVLTDETVKKWMTAFTPELVRIQSV